MGLLSKGTPLDWAASLRHHAYVKRHGIAQFLAIFAAQKNRSDDQFLWGDEVEHLLLQVNSHTKRVQLCLRAAELLDALEATPARASTFLPEYGRFQIEATPAGPYGGFTADLRAVEVNMRDRRAMIEKLLRADERLITLTAFPLMGCEGFAATSGAAELQGHVADSDYIPDEIIGAHPRFATLTRNIRTRRGARVDIRVPLFQDEHTQRDMPAAIAAEERALAALAVARASNPNLAPHPPRPADLDLTKDIHMDAMAFGMGQQCLQVTFQTRSVNEARHLYDHLAVFAPIMLALTAATPFFHGKVADIDVRWTVISQAVDDRTKVERGEEKMPDGSEVEDRSINGAGPYAGPRCAAAPSSASASVASGSAEAPLRKPQRLYKSRYDSISTYLSLEKDFKPEYNDLRCEIDLPSYEMLLENGVDELLSRHIAHLFTRDPLVIYDEHILLDDEKSSDHFENLQSTNWQSVRFKPPTPGSSIGWRVEFRTMEIQITDFENAAFTVFIALVSRALLYFNLNFYLPLSKVDVNMGRAHQRNAVADQKFFWRKHLKVCPTTTADGHASTVPEAQRDEYTEMSIREIMLGSPASLSGESQPGLINLVRAYLDLIDCDELTRRVVDEYLDLISKRASGELMTAASWLRKFVSVHPAYKHNSLLNDEVVFDIVETCAQVVRGTLQVPQLLGQYTNLPKAVSASGAAEPARELKGAQSCSASASASPAAAAAAASSPSAGHVLDLDQANCCEKLKLHLLPYIREANSTPSTPPRVASAASLSALDAPQATPNTPWLSPPGKAD